MKYTPELIRQKLQGMLVNYTNTPLELSAKPSELGLDSLDEVELLMDMEETFGIEIPDEAAETFTTFQAIIDYLYEQLKNETAR